MSKPYRTNSETWAGLAKLVEECSEVIQAAAKIMGGCDSPEHIAHLEDEIGDLGAALYFFGSNNAVDHGRILARTNFKLTRWNARRERNRGNRVA